MTKKLLLVDDSPTVRLMMTYALESAGYELATASDGVAALGWLRQQDFDLVILDIHMPNLDGLSMLEIIREKERWAGLRVIVLTTDWQESQRARAEALGAVAYLTKPSTPDEVVAQIAHVLEDAGQDHSEMQLL